MDRRRFLQWGSAGLATAALPGWIVAGYGQGRRDAGQRGLVRAAWEAARQRGRPLLVLTVPGDDERRYVWGAAWGEVIQHGGAEVLCDLALCDVACGGLAELRAALPELEGLPAEGEAEPIALLVETDEPVARPVPGPIEPVRNDVLRNDEAKERAYTEAVRARIEELSRRVRAAVAPDAATVERRARQAARACGLAEPVLAPEGRIDEAYAARAALAPACVRLARDRGIRREALTELLAGMAAARLRAEAPAGAQWARSTGCGIELEGEDGCRQVGCGMGYVPEISRRFLSFFHTEVK